MHKNYRSVLYSLLIIFSSLSTIALSSCNEKEEDIDASSTYVTTESVAVTAFSLKPDLRIMKNLDSVFFSIDLERGVIFNADSLPKGTNITKLVPVISYPSTVTSAVIEMTGGTHREGTSNYYTNASDTIDFTGDVTLTLGTSKDALKKTYSIKVNVHQQDPDTIYWDRVARQDLPSRIKAPKAQKTVVFNGKVYTLLEEADGSYTIATTSDIFESIWDKAELSSLDFTPVISSLTASADVLYILSDDGQLLSSAEGQSWTPVDSGWNNIIGMFGDTLLGLNVNGAAQYLKSWPEEALPEMEMPSDFPISGFSSPIEFSSRWASDPTMVVFGGYTDSSNDKSPAWAFDGTQWVNIAENALPALSGLSVVKYYSYLNSATNGLLKEFEVYLAFGGRDADGNANNMVFISYDHGINWQRAQEYTQLPEGIEAGYMVDAIALDTPMQSNLSDRWKRVNSRRRLPFEIDGDLIKWNCPYIFLFGGYGSGMTLNDQIRAGVLQRLTFTPLF